MSDQTPAAAPSWRRHCANDTDPCIETLQRDDGTVGIRRSVKQEVVLTVGASEWEAFVHSFGAGEH